MLISVITIMTIDCKIVWLGLGYQDLYRIHHRYNIQPCKFCWLKWWFWDTKVNQFFPTLTMRIIFVAHGPNEMVILGHKNKSVFPNFNSENYLCRPWAKWNGDFWDTIINQFFPALTVRIIFCGPWAQLAKFTWSDILKW